MQQSICKKTTTSHYVHNVRVRHIYISRNLRACSHLGYKVERVAFNANTYDQPVANWVGAVQPRTH